MIVAAVARGRLRLLVAALAPRRADGGRGWIGVLPATLALAAMFVLVGVTLRGLFSNLAAAGAGPLQAAPALALVLTAALIGMLVLDLGEALASLLVDSDLELLRRAPIPARALLALKLADALPRSLGSTLLLALPALLAFASTYALPVAAWAMIPALVAALWALPLGVGLAVAILLSGLVPARRARTALALFTTLMLLLAWIAGSFLLPRLPALRSGEPDVLELLAKLPRGGFLPPASWAAHALAETRSAPLRSAQALLLLLASGVLALGAAGWSAARGLERAQAKLAAGEAGPPWRGLGVRPPGGKLRLPAARPESPVSAVMRRDLRLFARDWPVLADVLATATLWTLLPLATAPIYGGDDIRVTRLMLITLAVGLGHEIGAKAFPLERSAIAWVHLSPLSVGRAISGKFLACACLTMPPVLLVATVRGLAAPMKLLEWTKTASLVLPALALALGFGLWIGARYGDAHWTHPHGMLRLGGRLAGSGGLVAQILLGALAAAPARSTGSLEATFWIPTVVAATLMPPLFLGLNRRLRNPGSCH